MQNMLNVVLAAILPAYFMMGWTHDIGNLHVATRTPLVMDAAIPAATLLAAAILSFAAPQ
jgi:hypothetical protein